MVPISQEQETALQIVRTSSKIATAEQLAVVMQTEPRFYSLEEGSRIAWLGQQIIALNYMAHSQRTPNEYDLFIESSMLDQAIMEDDGLRGLTQIEMQEAFRKGIAKEYGEFYGITASSLIGFLKGFRSSAKRQGAIAILYAQEQKRIAAEKERENRLLYELKVRGFVNPWGKKEKRKVTPEESEAHRRKIEKQREEILKDHEE